MLLAIARFEFRYLLRNPLVWITGAIAFTMVFLSMNVDGFELGSEGGLWRNASYTILRNYVMLSVMFMFVTTSFVANAVIRDDETGYGPIIRSTRINKAHYVFGRYLGASAMAALLTAVITPATLLGSVMPWANPANLGPNRLIDHVYAYFVIALPNVVIHSAILFALATITRSMMAAYIGVVSFVAAFFTLQGALERPDLEIAVSVAEPFASRALRDAARYWTIDERNVMLPELSGALLYNRLLWVSIALAFLGVAYAAYRYSERGMSRRERRRRETAPQSGDLRYAAAGARGESVAVPVLPRPTYGFAALRALVWMRTRFEMKQVAWSPAFPVLLLWGIYVTVFVLLTQRYPDFRPEYPTTLSLIPEIEDAFRVIPLVIAIYYSGELVWRERDRRVHELIDSTALPNWAYVIPKTAALGLLFVSMLVANVSAAVVLQLSLGFEAIEPLKYLLWYILPAAFDSMLLVALAVFVQSISPHKAVGWGIMVLFLAWREHNKFARLVNHNLLNYGETPVVPLSDLNGAGSFWIGAWTVRLYWGALAVLLLVAAHLLWRRGTEVRLRPRIRRGWERLRGPAGVVAGSALVVFLATGAYAYYNTNVLNEYEPPGANQALVAEYERRYGKYSGAPQPSLEELTLEIDLHPRERRLEARGRYILRNRTSATIPELHVRMADIGSMELTSAAIEGAELVVDDSELAHRIYRLDRPMRPGETRVMTFETLRENRGFRNGYPETKLVENGTFLTQTEIMPILGVHPTDFHQDPEVRKQYGLPGEILPPKLEDVEATQSISFVNDWVMKSDITISTDADQTPIAPGSRVSDVTQGDRRTARFITTTTMRQRFSIQSARYAERHRMHRGVDLAVYYHPQHAWNVERMLDAMVASLDYFTEQFGPYPLDHFRIVEFPGYSQYAQAFAGTIPFSESIGFIADYDEPDTPDYVTGITAHEFAHQYFPGQVSPAETEGYTVLVETLAQYSAQMVIKRVRGEDQIRRYLRYELDRYLMGRAWAEEEPPLIRTLGQSYLAYRKGAMVMYLLHKRLGEESVNRALRGFLETYRFKGAPFPRTLELVAALRTEAKTEEQQALITDLFERITLYDLETGTPTAVRRPDGRWDVTVPVNAKKIYVEDGVETETVLDERIEIGLFSAEPGLDAFDSTDVIVMERHPIRSGEQVLTFVTDRKPDFAGVDPYNFYIDRNSGDNVQPVS